ncbi:hypothetical protein JV173_01440 [Acholeplasma equirhinis]|uniref:hypothetical protein n=1 Tax=Acholeplasma equirhinis TaxID=555393 RepID=UPI00197AACBA|nr:hypothetical protein [Acholeplasma equirhinis]MBN3490167.1 hypothetical protein [Acholeplasma equirhinis]
MSLDILINVLYILLLILAIAVVAFLIAFVVWNTILYPVYKKNELDKLLAEKKTQLDEIDIQIASEWKGYQKIIDENDSLRKEQIELIKKNKDLEKKLTQNEVELEKMGKLNNQLKKQLPVEAKKTSVEAKT